MSKLFKKLKAGLEDAIAHNKGKLNLRYEKIELPKVKANYKSKRNHSWPLKDFES